MTENPELHPNHPSTPLEADVSHWARWSRWAALFILASLSVSACGRRPPPQLPPTGGPAGPPATAAESDRTPSLAAPELEAFIEPTVVRRGDSALLRWEARNADRVVINHGIGPVETSGRIKFFPEETTLYQLVAEGPGGNTTKDIIVEVLLDRQPQVFEEDLKTRPLEEQFAYFVKPVFFGYDSAELTEDARKILDENASWLNQPGSRNLRFLIEGHCDERGTEEYNLALGDRRAEAVRSYLAQHGVSRVRMRTLSLGEERPFDSRQTEEGWALNRRAQFVLLSSP